RSTNFSRGSTLVCHRKRSAGFSASGNNSAFAGYSLPRSRWSESMSYDRPDTIKEHLSRKSTAHLQEIVRTKDLQRWSPEAIAAADAVLQDRQAGRAQEPLVPEEDPPLPPSSSDSSGLAVAGLAALGVLTGVYFLPAHMAG